MIKRDLNHVILTSHDYNFSGEIIPIIWGAEDPKMRGPVIASLSNPLHRNAIGTHSGSYTVYRALSIASGDFPRDHKPDLRNTNPTYKITPKAAWFDEEKIVSIDPWGALVNSIYSDFLEKGYDVRPTIAVTQAHLDLPEIKKEIKSGLIKIDGKIVTESAEVMVTKVAFEPVWFLPGVAKKLGIEEGELRRVVFQETGGMYPELITRPDIKVMLPPIGNVTAYVFGDPLDLADPEVELTCRVHDECNGSDVFGSDICTCRPYLVYGIQQATITAQNGGVGLVVYYRKEGRALGEVTKFLVYNARKRQVGGDSAATYFYRTECVAGVQDARFQVFMPDALNFFGIKKIHNFHSMSNLKYEAIVGSGIEIENRIAIPNELVPEDAQVEIEAKKAAGYFSEDEVKNFEELKAIKGRKLIDG